MSTCIMSAMSGIFFGVMLALALIAWVAGAARRKNEEEQP